MREKQKNRKAARKREEQRLKKLSDEGRLAYGVEVPLGAVIADRSQQVPNNSYTQPPAFYVDVKFSCKECGHEEIWTAERQKWYYEEAKGSLYATAVRCRDCRKKLNAHKLHQRDLMDDFKRQKDKDGEL